MRYFNKQERSLPYHTETRLMLAARIHSIMLYIFLSLLGVTLYFSNMDRGSEYLISGIVALSYILTLAYDFSTVPKPIVIIVAFIISILAFLLLLFGA